MPWKVTGFILFMSVTFLRLLASWQCHRAGPLPGMCLESGPALSFRGREEEPAIDGGGNFSPVHGQSVF